jgi:4-amino-4-deoxy-L-arabinose transferase-like glycosyltransferase
MDTYSRQLVFHGAVVLLVGLLCGAPYGRAVNRNAPAHIVHSWRVAHGSIPLGAALMFGVAAVLSHLKGSAPLKWAIALFLIVSSYAFCFSLPLAAVVGHRGLSSRGPTSAKLVYAGNVVGAVSSLVAAAVLIYAAYVSL